MAGAGAPSRPRAGTVAIDSIPLFPLNTVLFPGGRLPLRIFEQRYMQMAKGCLRDGAPFGVCLIREGAEVLPESGAPATPYDVGTLARIGEWDMPQLGVLNVIARGEQRFRVLEQRVERDGLLRARVEPIGDDRDAEVPAPCAICAKILRRIAEQQPALFAEPHRFDSASWVSARLAELLPLPAETKQELLELLDARARIERLSAMIRPAPEG